jgi:hypothetical protein
LLRHLFHPSVSQHLWPFSSLCKHKPSIPTDTMSFGFGGGGTGFGQTNQSSGFGTGSGFGATNTSTGRSLFLALCLSSSTFASWGVWDGCWDPPGSALPLISLLCFSGLRVGKSPQLSWEGGPDVGQPATATTRAKSTTFFIQAHFARAHGISCGLFRRSATPRPENAMQGWP